MISSSALRRAAIPADAMKRLRRTVSFAGLAALTTLFFNAGFSERDEVEGRSFLILNANGCGSSCERVGLLRRAGFSPALEVYGREGRDESRDEDDREPAPNAGLRDVEEAELGLCGRTKVRPTDSEVDGDNVICFLGPLLGADRVSESLPRNPPAEGRLPLRGAPLPSELLPRNPPADGLPPELGLEPGRAEVRPTGFDVEGDSVSFFLGPLVVVLLVLLFLGGGDDFVNGN